MTEKKQWIAAARERLKSPVRSRGREDSVAALVSELKPEIQGQRALNKSWKQIANDIYQNEKFADAIRAAFGRLSPKPAGKANSSPAKNKKADVKATRPAVSHEPKTPTSSADGMSPSDRQESWSLFNAQHDARDDQARAAGPKEGA